MTEEQASQLAEEATRELVQTLMAELTAALGDGGPEAAVRICSERAQELTREIGERRGLTIRRTARGHDPQRCLSRGAG